MSQDFSAKFNLKISVTIILNILYSIECNGNI